MSIMEIHFSQCMFETNKSDMLASISSRIKIMLGHFDVVQ
jgi:hypothetical protein